MNRKKIFILLPDGISLRNFVFTSFVEIGRQSGWELIFWHNLPYNFEQDGYKEVILKGEPRVVTDLVKRAKIDKELDCFSKRFNDPVYQTYKFTPSHLGFKKKLKNFIVSALKKKHTGPRGVEFLRKKLRSSERHSSFYRKCLQDLKKEQPDYVFCTSQRPIYAISPLTAAQDLGIPTGSFIFSWDNLPKATMVVQTDHYFVWSNYMRDELLKYYPSISSEQVYITGSPQFEAHFDLSLRLSKEAFFERYSLDPQRRYICFSGDDITTCPDDQAYLEDVACSVAQLNQVGYKIGIIFRRSPVDTSARYQKVLAKYTDLIVPIDPEWEKRGDRWNNYIPKKDDLQLLINTILHSEVVINLASSMVFDFAVFDKPCLYLNYDVKHKMDFHWTPQKVYNFVHFRSMPEEAPVIWVRSQEELKNKLKMALNGAYTTVRAAKKWFGQINEEPADQATNRIWQAIAKSVENTRRI